jgi:hypothetical protein
LSYFIVMNAKIWMKKIYAATRKFVLLWIFLYVNLTLSEYLNRCFFWFCLFSYQIVELKNVCLKNSFQIFMTCKLL